MTNEYIQNFINNLNKDVALQELNKNILEVIANDVSDSKAKNVRVYLYINFFTNLVNIGAKTYIKFALIKLITPILGWVF